MKKTIGFILFMFAVTVVSVGGAWYFFDRLFVTHYTKVCIAPLYGATVSATKDGVTSTTKEKAYALIADGPEDCNLVLTMPVK